MFFKQFFQNLLDCFEIEYPNIIYEDEQSYTILDGVGSYTLVGKNGGLKVNVDYILTEKRG